MNLQQWALDLGLDEADVLELLQLYCTALASDIKHLKAACRHNDAVLAASTAHSLKGSAGNLGFKEISAIAARTEKNARRKRLDGLRETITILNKHLNDLYQAC
jgi:HPt (histidine-containing phosphotransfer) domain-containing protein